MCSFSPPDSVASSGPLRGLFKALESLLAETGGASKVLAVPFFFLFLDSVELRDWLEVFWRTPEAIVTNKVE
jgi:hypothetical protein